MSVLLRDGAVKGLRAQTKFKFLLQALLPQHSGTQMWARLQPDSASVIPQFPASGTQFTLLYNGRRTMPS